VSGVKRLEKVVGFCKFFASPDVPTGNTRSEGVPQAVYRQRAVHCGLRDSDFVAREGRAGLYLETLNHADLR
jgi:hypothetical protein